VESSSKLQNISWVSWLGHAARLPRPSNLSQKGKHFISY
jgi:hypothetical protein